jgi:Cu-Zn family superoxide dismutase
MSSTVRAVCMMRGEVGVHGIVSFEQSAAGGPTTIKGKLHGLPAGKHGFHIHQFGDLSNGCTSAGAHFNPHGKTHGGPNDETRHVGDVSTTIITRKYSHLYSFYVESYNQHFLYIRK